MHKHRRWGGEGKRTPKGAIPSGAPSMHETLRGEGMHPLAYEVRALFSHGFSIRKTCENRKA